MSSRTRIDSAELAENMTPSDKSILRVLLVEDSEEDARLVLSLLRQGGYEPVSQRVQTAGAMKAALAAHKWDLVLADYNLPQFDAPAALRLLHESNLDLPFIVVSGGIGEDTAVAAMRAGAHDYLMKHNLARLAPAVERELREAANRSASREASRALRESELRYRMLWESATDAIVIFGQANKIHFANPAVERIFGHRPSDLVGHDVSMLQPDRICLLEREAVETQLEARMKRTQWRSVETLGRHKEGMEFPIEIVFSDMELEGERQFVAFIRDITDRTKAEQTITTSLHEKEILLREIHHRVKNNLQIICSLLHLHSNLVRDKKALDVFRESEARVRSMALIHEKLYQSESLTQIRFDEYIQRLVQIGLRTYGVGTNTARLEMHLEPISVGVELAVPLGLILNELISNSVRHGLSGGKGGVITVDLHKDNKGRLLLVVRDNGVGLPENFSLENTTSLGLRLVQLLTDQIDGDLAFRSNHGTEFRVTFFNRHHS